MYHPRAAVLLAFAALLLPLGSMAAKPDTKTFINAEKQEQFADQSAAIRQEMKAGGRFEHVTADERQDVEKQLDTIAALLVKGSDKRLSENDQLDLLAAQETANAILTQRDGRRLICEYTAPTGSNRKVKQCITYADRVSAHKESRRTMFDNTRKSPAEFCYDPLKC